jgi:predicted small secreted protein
MHRQVTVVALMLVVVVATVLAAACNTGTEVGEVTPATSTVAVVPTTRPRVATAASEADSEEAAVLAAVEGYWRTILAANDPPDPDHPDLEKYMTGPALETALANIRARELLSRAVRRPDDSSYRHNPNLVDVQPSTAVVTDCAWDDTVIVDMPSGSILNDAVETTLWRTELVRADGRWLVARNLIEGGWPGTTRCDG